MEVDDIGGPGLDRLLNSLLEDEDCQVQSLSIEGDLTSSHLQPDLFSRAVGKLDRINLDRARLDVEQLEVMLTAVRDQPQLALTSLSLDRSHGYPLLFSSLDSQLLREGFTDLLVLHCLSD